MQIIDVSIIGFRKKMLYTTLYVFVQKETPGLLPGVSFYKNVLHIIYIKPN